MAMARLLAAVAAAAVVLSGAPSPVRLIGALPLVFVLPGYGLTLNVVPRSADLATRLAWTLALSISASVLLPILAGAAGAELSAGVWVAGLVAVTVVGELAALRVRRTMAPPRPRPAVPVWSVAAVAVAGLVVASGLWFSWADAESRASPTATQLWMVPGNTASELRIGVTSYGGAEAPARLVVEEGSVRQEFPLSSEPGTFETTWTISNPQDVVRASLYSSGESGPMREVFHRPDGQ